MLCINKCLPIYWQVDSFTSILMYFHDWTLPQHTCSKYHRWEQQQPHPFPMRAHTHANECVLHVHVYTSTVLSKHIHKSTYAHIFICCYVQMCYDNARHMHVQHAQPNYSLATETAFENVVDSVVSSVRAAQETKSSPSLVPTSLSVSLSVTTSSLLEEIGRLSKVLSATRRHLFPKVSCSFFQPSTSYRIISSGSVPHTHIHMLARVNILKVECRVYHFHFCGTALAFLTVNSHM